MIVSRGWITVLVAAAVVISSLPAAAFPRPVPLDPQVFKSLNQYQREYILQAGDQVEVTVFHVPEVSRSVTIRPDGFVSLPVLKDVKLAGLTVPEADDLLARLYRGRLINPEVTVSVTNPRAAAVYVMGEVNRPGPVALREAPSAALAIAGSGGVARSAKLDGVAIVRLTDDGRMTAFLFPRPQGGVAAFYMTLATMTLQAGDIVVVPESARSQFVRFLQDFVNTPLAGVNQALSPYYQFKILALVTPAKN